MDRKKTLLMTALINAVLLAVLFIAALYREEDVSQHLPVVNAPQAAPRPLFSEPREAAASSAPEPLALPSDSIAYQLPPLAVESQPTEPFISPSIPSRMLEVTVKKGDTLEKIAKAHQVAVAEILQANNLPSHFLRIGQVLKIPAPQTAQTKSPLPEAAMPAAHPEYYVVKVGDNPWTIAMKHHMKVDELLKLNQMSEDRARRLKPGDRLRIR